MDRERELLTAFIRTKREYEELEEKKSEAYKQLESAKRELVEYLESSGKEKTAEYKDLGHATLLDPTPIGSYTKENEEIIFDFVRQQDREDIIRPTIHWKTLSSFIKESMENGVPFPEELKIYLKPNIRLLSK